MKHLILPDNDERRLIFWFDAKAEFVDDIDALELNNAKILHLELH